MNEDEQDLIDSDADTFAGAFADQPQGEPDKPEEPRDEDAVEAREPEAEQSPEPEADTLGDEPPAEKHHIPLAEYLSTRERAQKAEAEREAERQRSAAFERELQALRQEQSKPKPEPIDPIEDPQGWQKQQLSTVEESMQNMQANFSQMLAERHYGKGVVDDAFQWILTRPAHEQQAVKFARDPYGEMVERKKQADTLAEIGTDPSAYRERLKSEFMKDPEFVSAVMAAAKAEAGARPDRHETRLPPSLNRQQSAANAKSDAGSIQDLPDGELLDDAFSDRRR